jgi:NADH:ubiquinone oxidoreductase subunit C
MEFQTIKATLDGTPTIDENAQYFVDFSKLTKIEELILILAAMGINFNPKHPYFDSIKHLLNLNQPVKVGVPTEQKEMNLPTLKTLKKNGE